MPEVFNTDAADTAAQTRQSRGKFSDPPPCTPYSHRSTLSAAADVLVFRRDAERSEVLL